MRTDIVERAIERLWLKRALPRPHGFAAEAEPAIGGAGIDKLEQHPVGIAVHDALDRAMGLVADRIAALLRLDVEFARIGNELPGDRVMRIRWIDQASDRRRDGDGIARRHLIERGQPLARHKRGIGQVGGVA